MVKIVALLGKNGGDNANAMGIQAALAAQYEAAGIPVENILSEDEAAGGLSPDERYIFIAAGKDMLSELASYKHPNVLNVWGGHEPTPALLLNAHKLDVVQLPEYTLNPVYKAVLRSKLAPTLHGVPHSLTAKMIEEDFRSATEKSDPSGVHIPEAEKYALVALGGDADGRIFSPEEAHALGKAAGTRAQKENFMLLGTSSPRTGGRENHKPDMPLDAVSQAFLDGVRESGLPMDRTQFYPYYDDDKPSALPSLMGAVRAKPGSFALMPGDSATMITQGIDLLPIGATEIYETAAMGENHYNQVSHLLNKGLINKWQEPKLAQGQKPAPAAEMVADKVVERAHSMRILPAPPAASQGRAL